MGQLDKTIWLKPASAGCPSCVPSDRGPVCVAQYGQPCGEPRLVGEASLILRALEALRGVADAGGNLVDGRRVSALRIGGGEAELTLALPAACDSAEVLADDAFRALRGVLPDTDIYVRRTG